jgi:hypothetical protein
VFYLKTYNEQYWGGYSPTDVRGSHSCTKKTQIQLEYLLCYNESNGNEFSEKSAL